MKRLVLIFISFVIAISAFCVNLITQIITLYSIPLEEKSEKDLNVFLSPIRAIQEGNIIRISSDKESNAHVRITDSDGVVVRDEYIDLSQQENIVTLPDGNESKEYMIEIEFEDTYMYGFINNN